MSELNIHNFDARINVLRSDLEVLNKMISEQFREERSRKHTLMMRVKRLERLLSFVIQFIGLGIGIGGVYLGINAYQNNRFLELIAIISGIIFYWAMIGDANGDVKKIREREHSE